uniref:TFIIS-type domain-containing protein n=1 Tax=Zea mays TaxID=4577 RepID=A0A804N6E8_MAIZE
MLLNRFQLVIWRGRDRHCLHCHIVEQRLVQERRNMLQEKAYVHNSSSLHMTASFFSLLDSFHFCPLGYKDFPDLALKWRVELMKQDKRAKVLCLHGFCTSESFLKSRSTTGTLPLVMDMGMRIQSYDDQLLHLAADLAQRLLPTFDTPTVNSTIPGLVQEVSDNNCVYRNEVHHTAGERTQVLQDVASDPTLPRTKTVRCNLCGHGEVVFFQAAARGEEGMTLFFVCCSPDCGYRWRE